MCGIAGYIGERNAPELLFDMLKRLEYRGYDSAGLAYIAGDKISIPKDKGKVDEVRKKVRPEKIKSKIGVAHTRWATHGVPSQLNAHPHLDCSGKFAVAHNGIIENYKELTQELTERGHNFQSETDTEVITHLIEGYYDGNFREAFEKALNRLEGSYAIAAISTMEPDVIMVARKESPLIIGMGDGEKFLASDAPAFLAETKKVIILEDMEYGIITKDEVKLFSIETGKSLKKKVQTITWDIQEAEKGGYHHFMLKEIFEEPQAAKNALRSEKEVSEIAKRLGDCDRIYFVACGTAYHAGLFGKYLLESFGINADACVASEFRYSTVNTLDERSAVITISQSGETADTIAAIKGSKKKGSYVGAIVNVVGSTITRISDNTAYTNSGPEIAVASTKAYIGQLVSVGLLALHLAREREKITEKEFKKIRGELDKIPDKISKILERNSIRELAELYANTQTFFFIGRRGNFPTALEGALKLKEISYVHAEGYPAGELKHGPLALLEEGVVVIAALSQDDLKGKMASNIQEAKARDASVIVVSEDGELKIPKTHPLLSPILNIVPLHLFAYYISVLKGIDPDKPRNLAKSVTVE